MAIKTADQLSDEAKLASLSASHWLEHATVALKLHLAAAEAHEKEAIGEDKDRHLWRATEHRNAAKYWARRESMGY